MTIEPPDRFESFRTSRRDRLRAGRLRSLTALVPVPGTPYVRVDGRRLLNFCSNDYLGLATDPDSVEAARAIARSHGVGAGASRLVTGTFDIHGTLERDLAELTGRPAALLFNSGFQANTSIVPAITDRRGLILSDRNVHNSLIQGCRLSRARVHPFDHNDPGHLESLVRRHGPEADGRTLIVTESVFSMDGDRAPLADIADVADRHGALLMVDDAHAFGVLGREGRGLAAHEARVDLLIGTFGKALGGSGAFVACNEILRDHLVNHCAGFIYSTAPPPPTLGAVAAGLDRIRSEAIDLEGFAARVRTAHERLRAVGFDTSPSDSHIVPIRVGTDEDAVACAEFLRKRDILAVPIRPPTVPEGTARLRISLGIRHTLAHIDTLVDALRSYRDSRRRVRTGAAADRG